MTVLPYRTRAEREAAAAALGRHLRAGGLIAYPTETVYGFGSIVEPSALDRLTRLKRRPAEKPFLLLVRRAGDAPGLDWTPAASRLVERFWPGPLTLVLADPGGAYPPGVRSPSGTVALRASPHPAVASVLVAAGGPVTSTSANLPGEQAATDAAAAARAATGAKEVLVLDGGTLPPSPSSTIVDCTAEPVRIIRPGALAQEHLREVVEIADA